VLDRSCGFAADQPQAPRDRLQASIGRSERFFYKLKHFRRGAARCDKLAANLLAMVQLASMRLWLRAYGSAA
jgi:transposase